MEEEVTRILNTNVADLTSEDKTKIGIAATAGMLVTAAVGLVGFIIWKNRFVRNTIKEAEAAIQQAAE